MGRVQNTNLQQYQVPQQVCSMQDTSKYQVHNRYARHQCKRTRDTTGMQHAGYIHSEAVSPCTDTGFHPSTLQEPRHALGTAVYRKLKYNYFFWSTRGRPLGDGSNLPRRMCGDYGPRVPAKHRAVYIYRVWRSKLYSYGRAARYNRQPQLNHSFSRVVTRPAGRNRRFSNTRGSI